MTSVLALINIVCVLTLISVIWRKNQFHPAISFLILATADVFFPAIYWTLFGQVNNPEWLPLLTEEKLLVGIAYYSVFLYIFIGCFLGVDGCKAPRQIRGALPVGTRARIAYALWFLLALTLIKIGMEIGNHGGLEPWFWSRVMSAALTDANDSNAVADGWFSVLPTRDLFQAAVGVAFYYRKQFSRSWLFTIFFPTVAMVLAMMTFLRGAVMACAVTLIFAEVIRQKALRRSESNAKRFGTKVKFFTMMIVAVVLSMYVYGSIRDSFRGLAGGREDSTAELIMPTFLTAGHGLLGLSHILADYGQEIAFLGGKTYIDMLLLPVPRSIYLSKPTWYGIDDITRGMGWPESTQSAVTMPGEAFANFGLLGLLVAVPLGMAFGLLQHAVRSNQFRFLLMTPAVFFQVVSVANWMSLTGIMNAVPTLVLLFALAAYIERGVVRFLLLHWIPPRRISVIDTGKAR